MRQNVKINRIILVDDDPITNMINTKILQKLFNPEVVAFTDSRNALVELKKLAGSNGFPEIIFLDINMPHMDGWQFLTEYEKLPAEQLLQTKLYMLSSSIDFGDIEKSKKFKSVKGFLSKPLLPEALADLISDDNVADADIAA